MTQEVGRSGGYGQLSYVSTLEKAAIDTGVSAGAVNTTTTDLWQIIRYWFKPKHSLSSYDISDKLVEAKLCLAIEHT